MSKIALIVTEEELEYLEMLLLADQEAGEDPIFSDPEEDVKYRFHCMNLRSLNMQLENKIGSIFQQIDNQGGSLRG